MSSNPNDYTKPVVDSSGSGTDENDDKEAAIRPTTSFVDKLLVQAYPKEAEQMNASGNNEQETPEAEAFLGPKSKVQNKSYSISPNNIFSSIVITQLSEKIRSKEDIDVQVIQPNELHLIATGEMLAKCEKLNERLRKKGIKSSKSASSLLNESASFTANLGGILDVSNTSSSSSERQFESLQSNIPQFDTAETHSLSFCYYVDEEQPKDLDTSQLNDPCIDFKSYSRRKGSSPSEKSGSNLRALSAPLYRDAASATSLSSRSKSKDMGRIEEYRNVGSQTIICSIQPNPTISTQTSPDLARRNLANQVVVPLNNSEKSIGNSSSTATLTSETLSPNGTNRFSQQDQSAAYSPSSKSELMLVSTSASTSPGSIVQSSPTNHADEIDPKKQAETSRAREVIVSSRESIVTPSQLTVGDSSSKIQKPPTLVRLESSPETTPKKSKEMASKEEPVANYQSSSSSNSFHSAISSSAAFAGPVPMPRHQDSASNRVLEDFDVSNIENSPIKVWTSTSIATRSNGNASQTTRAQSNDIYDYQREVDEMNSNNKKPFIIECKQEFFTMPDQVQSRIDSAMASLAEDLNLSASKSQPTVKAPAEQPLFTPRKPLSSSVAPVSNVIRTEAKSTSVSPSRSSAALKTATYYPLSVLNQMEADSANQAADSEPVLSKLNVDPPSKSTNALLANLPPASKPKWETSAKYSVETPAYQSQQRPRIVSETSVTTSVSTKSKPLTVISNNNPGIKKKVLFHDWENLIDNLAQEQEKQRQIEIERSKHLKPTPFSQSYSSTTTVTIQQPPKTENFRAKAAEQFKTVRERYGSSSNEQRVDSESPPPPPLPPRPHKVGGKVVPTSVSTCTHTSAKTTTTSKTTYLSTSVLKSTSRPTMEHDYANVPRYENMPRYENDHYFSVDAPRKQPSNLSKQHESFEVLNQAAQPTSVSRPSTAAAQQSVIPIPVVSRPAAGSKDDSYTQLSDWQSNRRRANSSNSQQAVGKLAGPETLKPSAHNNYKNPLLKSSLSAENVNDDVNRDENDDDNDDLENIAKNLNINGATPSLKRFYLKKDAPDDALSLLGLGKRHQPRQNLSQNDLNLIERQQKKQVELLEQKQQQQQPAPASFVNESNMTGVSSGNVSAGSAKLSRTMIKLMNSTVEKEYEKLMRRIERRRVRVPQILETLRNGQVKGKEKKKLEEELRYLMRRSDKDQILLKRFLQMAQNNHPLTPAPSSAFEDDANKRKNRDTSDENRLSASEEDGHEDDDDDDDDDEDDSKKMGGRVVDEDRQNKVRFKLAKESQPNQGEAAERAQPVEPPQVRQVPVVVCPKRNERLNYDDTEETTNFESSSAASFATIDNGRSLKQREASQEIVESSVEATEHDDKIHLMMKTKLKMLNGQRTKESGYSSCDESGNETRKSSNKTTPSRYHKVVMPSNMHAIEDVNEYQPIEEYVSRKVIKEAIDKATPGGATVTLARAPIYQSEYVRRQPASEQAQTEHRQSYNLATQSSPATTQEQQRYDQYNYEILNPVSPRIQPIAGLSPKINELSFEFAPRDTRQQASTAVLSNDGSGSFSSPGSRAPVPVRRRRNQQSEFAGERASDSNQEHAYVNDGLNASANIYDSQYTSPTSGVFANDTSASFTGTPFTNISMNSSFSQPMHPRGETSHRTLANPTGSNSGQAGRRTGPVINRAAGSSNDVSTPPNASNQGGSNSNLNNNNNNAAPPSDGSSAPASDVYTSAINYNSNTTLVGSTVVADSANIHIQQHIRTRSKSPGSRSADQAANANEPAGPRQGSSNSINQNQPPPPASEFKVEYVKEEELGTNYRNNYQVQTDYETGELYIINYLRRIKYIIVPAKPKQPQQPSPKPTRKDKSPLRIDINNNQGVQVQRLSKPPHEQSQSEFIVDYIQEDDLADLYLNDYEIYTDRDTCESILYNRNNPTRRWIILPTNWRHTTYYAQQDVDIANFKIDYCPKTRRRYVVDEVYELGAKVVKKSFVVPMHCISSKKDFLAKWDYLTQNPIVIESAQPSPRDTSPQHSPIYSTVQKKHRSNSINSTQSLTGSLAERTISEPFISDSNQVLHLIHDESGELDDVDDDKVIINYVEERIFNAELNSNRLPGIGDAEAFFDPDTSEPILVHPARPNIRWIVLPDNWRTSEESPYITQEDVNLMEWDVYEDTLSRRKYIIDEKSGQRFYLVHTTDPAPLDDALSSNFRLMWVKLIGQHLATNKPLKSSLKPRIPTKRSKSSNELETMENFQNEPSTSKLRTSAHQSPERLNSIINKARANSILNGSMTSSSTGRPYTVIKQPGKMGHLIPNVDARANPPVGRRSIATPVVAPKAAYLASNKPKGKSKSPATGVKKPSLSKLQQDALRKQFLSQKIPDIGKLWMHQLLISDINKKKRLRLPFGYRPEDDVIEYDPNYRTWRCLMKSNDPTSDDGALNRDRLNDCQVYGYNKFNAKEYYRDRDNNFYANSLQDPNRCGTYNTRTGTAINSPSHAGFGGGDQRFAKGVLTEHFKESRQYEPRYITRNHRALVPKARLHLRQQFLCTPKYLKGHWTDVLNKDSYHLKPRIILINDEERILSANKNCNVYVQYMYENDAVLGANPAYQLMLPGRGPTSPTRPLLVSPKQLDRTHKLMNNSNSTLYNRNNADIALREAPVYVYHADGSAYFENIAQYLAGNYARLSPKTVRKILQFSNMKEFEDYLASKITRDEAKRIAQLSGSELINVDAIKRDLLGSISVSDDAASLNTTGPVVYHQRCEYDPLRNDHLDNNSGSTRLNRSQDSNESSEMAGSDLNDTQEVIIAGNLMKSTFIGFQQTGQVQRLSYHDLPDSLLEAVQDADQLDFEYQQEKEKENKCDEASTINYSNLLLSARMKNLSASEQAAAAAKSVNFYGNRPASSSARPGPARPAQPQPNKPKFDFQATLRSRNTNDYTQAPTSAK